MHLINKVIISENEYFEILAKSIPPIKDKQVKILKVDKDVNYAKYPSTQYNIEFEYF